MYKRIWRSAKKIWRSAKSKRFLLRMPPELFKSVKDNKDEDQSVNDFILSCIKEKLLEAATEEPSELPEAKPLSSELRSLINVRDGLILGRSKTEKPKLLTVKNIKENWLFKDAFLELEYCHLKFDSGLMPDLIEALIEKVGEKAYSEYFEKIDKLSWDDKDILREELQRRDDLRRCQGDPEEVVYKDITRQDIYYRFEKHTRYSVADVAAELKLTYTQAYTNVVPWMKGEGFLIE